MVLNGQRTGQDMKSEHRRTKALTRWQGIVIKALSKGYTVRQIAQYCELTRESIWWLMAGLRGTNPRYHTKYRLTMLKRMMDRRTDPISLNPWLALPTKQPKASYFVHHLKRIKRQSSDEEKLL